MIQPAAMPPLLRQALTFSVVGAIATGVHFAFLAMLVEIAGMAPVIASTIGYCVGVLVSFVLNRAFTFGRSAPLAQSFAKYVALYGVGLALNGMLLSLLIDRGAPYLLAQAASTAIVLIWNFLGSRFFAFR